MRRIVGNETIQRAATGSSEQAARTAGDMRSADETRQAERPSTTFTTITRPVSRAAMSDMDTLDGSIQNGNMAIRLPGVG